MYELVKTSRQQRNFAKTWEYFCTKYGWINDPYAENGMRYNLYLHKKAIFRRNKVIGTIEFIPYDPNNPYSTVEGPDRFRFSHYDEVKNNLDYVWEIDKLCIHQDYQRQGHVQSLIQMIGSHAEQTKAKYYLAIIENKFYRMLRMTFGSIVVQKGDKVMGINSKNALVPTLIKIEQGLNDKHIRNKIFQVKSN